MKKPIAIICNDLHIKEGNEDDVLRSIAHLIKYAKKIGVDELILAGDVFDVRRMQRLGTLMTFQNIIDSCNKNELILHIIPGNHDKPDYQSEGSYIDLFTNSNINYYPQPEQVTIEGVSFTMMPFFADDIQVKLLGETEGSDILIGHFELNGSTNLGKVSKNRPISQGMLKKWKKTYLGHYHNWHEITSNIVHLPSIRQNNFGEDSNKGFAVIYDDLSYEIIKGDFQELRTVRIDVDKVTMDEVNELINLHKVSKDRVRFEVTGTSSKLKAFDRSKVTDSGIEIIVKHKDIEFNVEDVEMPVSKHNEESVEKMFKDFCLKNNRDYDEGMIYLQKFLKK